MGDAVPGGNPALEAEEARLARAAAAGDGEAFATLYERYSQRAYNLAVRVCGSEEDAADAVQEAFLSVIRRLGEIEPERELAFGSYLFTATRNATYDLMRRQQRARPSDAIPESATPLGSGAGGLGLDPGDPEEDPDRKQLLAAQQEEVREANARLPERQREALALRELEEMSYDEIAVVMEMNRNSVAQLISRARINLRDELRGTALASVSTSSPECERALPLVAARDDRQLDPESADAAWLASHLSTCDTCLVATAAMAEAGVSYRAWIPLAVAPWVFKETMAQAAELTGSDWSEVVLRHSGRPGDPSRVPGMPAAYDAAPQRGEEDGPRRRRVALVGVLALLLLLGGAVIALSSGGGGEDPAPEPARFEVAEDELPEPAAEPEPKPDPVEKKQEKVKPQPTKAKEQTPVAVPEPLPVTEASAPSTAPPAESKTKTKAPPASEPKGGEAGLDGSSVRDPQPESTPPAEQPPTQPPAGEEEPAPPTQPPPKPPKKGPGELTSPPGPPKPG